jgi:hypothetical protein
MLPLEAVLLFRLLSCDTAGTFDTIKELCSPSNSCEQQRSTRHEDVNLLEKQLPRKG